ncbi:MAG: hypothetical protein RLZZ342_3 [Candidatus Parcubacteria bacterium]|jgi:hypothetical protein
MRKTKQIEEMIKRAIRDELALNPLKSVSQIQVALFKQGYQQVYGKLDWHYVSKLVKSVRLENLASLYTKDRSERLAQIKERHRVITEKLVGILEGEAGTSYDKPNFPTHAERIAAANTILKWDTALFFMEEQVNAIDAAGESKVITLQPVLLEAPRVVSYPQTHVPVLAQSRTASLQDQDTSVVPAL